MQIRSPKTARGPFKKPTSKLLQSAYTLPDFVGIILLVSKSLHSAKLRWEDCLKRDTRKAEEEEKGEKRPTTGTDGKETKVGIQRSDE